VQRDSDTGNMPEFAQADPHSFWVPADTHERANGRTGGLPFQRRWKSTAKDQFRGSVCELDDRLSDDESRSGEQFIERHDFRQTQSAAEQLECFAPGRIAKFAGIAAN
jgi:hypothetical protein